MKRYWAKSFELHEIKSKVCLGIYHRKVKKAKIQMKTAHSYLYPHPVHGCIDVVGMQEDIVIKMKIIIFKVNFK